MDKRAISPCPFCGSFSATCLEIDTLQWAISCEACQSNGPTMPSREAAIGAWEAVHLKLEPKAETMSFLMKIPE